MKFFIAVFFVFSLSTAFAQVTVNDINRRLTLVSDLMLKGKTDETIRISKEILKVSKELSYSHGIAEASLNIAFVLNQRHEFKNSNEYLKIAETENVNVGSGVFTYKINKMWADRFFSVGLYDAAEERYRHASNADNSVLDGGVCANISNCFEERKLHDSAAYYRNRAYRLLKGNKNPEAGSALINVCVSLAMEKIRHGELISARTYLKEGQELAKETGQPQGMQRVKIGMGNLSMALHKADSAIVFFEEAIVFAKRQKDISAIKSLYQSLASVYKLNKNTVKYAECLELYQRLSDSLAHKNNLMFVVDAIVHENERSNRKKVTDFVFIGGLICIPLVLLANFRKIKRRIRQHTLLNRNDDFGFSAAGNKNLDARAALTLLDELARTRHPSFFLRFVEVYPDFKNKLITRYPSLSLSDVEFCAYLRMNFDTKEIALYGNMTVRSVEARKYRLRKKMNISSTENMNFLMIDL